MLSTACFNITLGLCEAAEDAVMSDVREDITPTAAAPARLLGTSVNGLPAACWMS